MESTKMEQKQINLQEMTLEQLKALCYDFIVQQAQVQQSINTIQAEINKRELPGI